MITTSPWLVCRRQRPEAAARMYCFPHSGGLAGEYLRWSDDLPGVELWGVQLPGRGSRMTEPSLTAMGQLVEAIVAEIDTGTPYVFLGHSLGALVAYETARTLRDRGAPAPERLILSAYRAPHLHQPGEPVHLLDHVEFLAHVEATYGPLPAEIRADPDLCSLVLGGLRADLGIVTTYRHTPSDPLECPITVVGGRDDEEEPAALVQWCEYTTGPFDLRLFPGDHFYFREHTDEFLRFLDGVLA